MIKVSYLLIIMTILTTGCQDDIDNNINDERVLIEECIISLSDVLDTYYVEAIYHDPVESHLDSIEVTKIEKIVLLNNEFKKHLERLDKNETNAIYFELSSFSDKLNNLINKEHKPKFKFYIDKLSIGEMDDSILNNGSRRFNVSKVILKSQLISIMAIKLIYT